LTTLLSPELQDIIDMRSKFDNIQIVSLKKEDVISLQLFLSSDSKKLSIKCILPKQTFKNCIENKRFFNLEILDFPLNVILQIESVKVDYDDEDCHATMICKILQKEKLS